MATAISATSSGDQARHCQACEKTASEIKLFWCARCKQVSYCVRLLSPTCLIRRLTPGSPPLSQSKECQTSNWKSHKAFCSNQVGVNNSLQHLANATPGTVERETYEVEARLKRWIEVRFWFYRQMCPPPETDWPDSFQSALSRKGRNCCNSRSHHAIDTRKGPDSPPCCHTLAQSRLLGLEYRACYLTLFPLDRTRCHYP